MVVTHGQDDRASESHFSDPSRDRGSPPHDSMEASLAEMERARSAHPASSSGDHDGEPGSPHDHAAGTAENTQGGARGMAERAYEVGREAVGGVGRRATEEPWLAMAISFVAGYALACLVHGGRRWG